LFALFAALLIDQGSGSFSAMRSLPGRGVPVHAELTSGAAGSAYRTVNFSEA
jgi:hypothetical protein